MKISCLKPQFLALALGLLGTSLAVQAEENRAMQQNPGFLADQALLGTLSQKLGIEIADLSDLLVYSDVMFCDGFEQPQSDMPDNCYFGGVTPAVVESFRVD